MQLKRIFTYNITYIYCHRHIYGHIYIYTATVPHTDAHTFMRCLILWDNLFESWTAQPFGQTLCWAFMSRCFWMRLTFKFVD